MNYYMIVHTALDSGCGTGARELQENENGF